MRRTMRQITALLLAALMMIACAACGNDKPAETKPEDKKQESAPAASPTGTPETTPTDSVQETTLGTKVLTGSSGTAPAEKPMDETMRKAYADFAYRLFNSCVKSQNGASGNCLISPFSVYTALSMVACGANGNTAAQMNEILGLDEAGRNAFMAAWIAALTGQDKVAFTCADSVWVNNRFREEVLDEFLKACADSYRAEVYAADMNDKTVDDINDWTNKNTKEMIPAILEHGDLYSGIVAVLVNAITLDAKWALPFDTERIDANGVFTHGDGREETVAMMHGEADRCYLENEFFTGCAKSYQGGEFRYVALLPKDGVSMEEAIASLTPGSVDSLFSGAETVTVNLWIPKYTTEYKQELQDILAALGMDDAFSFGKADFTRMIRTGAKIDRVIHKTYLSLDNEGTKAAAVTAVTMRNLGMEKTRTVKLDRPFVYMIVDGNNLPLFIGTYR